jgi:flagellar biosynthesis/type III secretory pathway M-ring protein FliF/YscJ
VGRRRRKRKPQTRFGRWFERVALGAVMGAVAFVVERRLVKVIKRRGREEEEARPASKQGDRQDLELTPGSKQVDDQTARQQTAHHPQDRR